MSNYKTSELLYKSRQKRIRLCSRMVGETGMAGMVSESRGHVSLSIPAKYSTLALILDLIFEDHTLIAYQSKGESTGIYVKFKTKKGTEEEVYEAIYLDELKEVRWLGRVPNGYYNLIPIFVYTMSDLYVSENKNEYKKYFENLKEGINVDESVLLLCDTFYYDFAKRNPYVTSEHEEETKREIIDRCISTGVYKKIPIFEKLDTNITEKDVAVEEAEEKKDNEGFNVNYEWNEEQKINIPSPETLKTFVMTDTTLQIAKKVKYRMDKVIARLDEGKTGMEAIGPDYINILLVGRPATGKTALANAVAALTGMPIYTVPFSKHTEEDTVEGKNKVVDGKIGFVETEFLKAYQNGGIIVVEEINLADPGVVMGSLGQAIEKPFIVMKDGYIPVKRHPLCVIIGTMNTGTAGSKQLNQALSSRFKCTYILDDPDKNTFIQILESAGYKKQDCRSVYKAYDKINKFLKSPEQSQEELCDNITLRGCFGALECIEEGQTIKESITNSLIGKIAEVDLEAAREVQKVIDSLAL